MLCSKANIWPSSCKIDQFSYHFSVFCSIHQLTLFILKKPRFWFHCCSHWLSIYESPLSSL
ncbi:hypothetical protein LINPERPRIM_LOCUS23721 [Linum perenne]